LSPSEIILTEPTTTELKILEEIKKLAISVVIIDTKMVDVIVDVAEATRALKGYNGTPGLVGKFDTFKGEVNTKLGSLKDTLDEVKDHNENEVACRAEFVDFKKDVMEYPSLTWIMRYKPKTFMVAAVSVILFLVIISPLINQAVAAVILSWLGVPGGLVGLFNS
jgi:hypothetical protein